MCGSDRCVGRRACRGARGRKKDGGLRISTNGCDLHSLSPFVSLCNYSLSFTFANHVEEEEKEEEEEEKEEDTYIGINLHYTYMLLPASFIHSLTHSLIYSFIHPLYIHSFPVSFMHLPLLFFYFFPSLTFVLFFFLLSFY